MTAHSAETSIIQPLLPVPDKNGHKYDKGHVLVNSGDFSGSGATKLAAGAALRTGAGLVTVCAHEKNLPMYAASFASVMVKPANTAVQLTECAARHKVNAFVIGCGNGINDDTADRTLALLNIPALSGVIDADALNVFASSPEILYKALHARHVLTPHESEFRRLFSDIKGDRETRALTAAKVSGAVTVLKGRYTVIASPCGQVHVNENAPASLATAGSGDVLSGMVAGLLAQGLSGYDAARAGVYVHSACAASLPAYGLIAEDIIASIPDVLTMLHTDLMVA